MSDLIDNTNRVWKVDSIRDTFSDMDTRRILHFPLSRFSHNNYQVWFGEASGEFTVRSAYRFILQQSPVDWSDMVSNVELLEWVSNVELLEWVTWFFARNSVPFYKLFVYIWEIEGQKFSIPIRRWESKNWSPLQHPLVKINFDAALWESKNRSSSGIVIREKYGQ
ncbi:hypothetical protein Golax_016748, partial [Gossypium laxum]|nr:hypothetical protein [Gossypium laxum]